MNHGKVLLVDSRSHISESVKTYLQRQGFIVSCIRNESGALYQLFHDPPDIAVIEAALPGMNGTQFCRWIRQFTQTPIILLGSNGDETEVITALSAGADDFLAPPYRFGELLARMESVLRRHRLANLEKSQSSLNDRSIVVDLLGHKVYVREKRVTLTKTEYGLLTYLMRHAGHTFTAKQLMHAVWGSEYFTFENVAWHICRLRKKIEEDPHKPRLIVKVPGFGYRYERDS
jgi:DNA-binding response OmpR family regulator